MCRPPRARDRRRRSAHGLGLEPLLMQRVGRRDRSGAGGPVRPEAAARRTRPETLCFCVVGDLNQPSAPDRRRPSGCKNITINNNSCVI